MDEEVAQSSVPSLSGQQTGPSGQCQRPSLVPQTGVEGSLGSLSAGPGDPSRVAKADCFRDHVVGTNNSATFYYNPVR